MISREPKLIAELIIVGIILVGFLSAIIVVMDPQANKAKFLLMETSFLASSITDSGAEIKVNPNQDLRVETRDSTIKFYVGEDEIPISKDYLSRKSTVEDQSGIIVIKS